MKYPSITPSISPVWLLLPLVSVLSLTSCVSVKTENKVEPIQITMDVNVRLERELEDAFGELDARSQEIANNQNAKGEE